MLNCLPNIALNSVKFTFIAIILSLFCLGTTEAQTVYKKTGRFQIGLMAGGSTYEGDLAPSTFWVSFSETHFTGGVYARYQVHPMLAFRTMYLYGALSATDGGSLGVVRRARNLSFESRIHDMSFVMEVYLLGWLRPRRAPNFYPYVFAGAGVFNFDPTAEFEGVKYRLQPLGTEGQGLSIYPERTPYKLTQFSVPWGVGAQFKIDRSLRFGINIGFHKSFTDYIDDVSLTYPDFNALREERGELAVILSDRTVPNLIPGRVSAKPNSQRGDPVDKDWYIMSTINLGVIPSEMKLFREVKFKNKKKKTQKCPFPSPRGKVDAGKS